MKAKFNLLIVLLFLIHFVGAQEWFPVGSKWHFNEQELLPYPAHGYTKYNVAKDTLVRGKNAKLIEVNQVDYNGVVSIQPAIIVMEENGRVYYYAEPEFKLMYDFNLAEGDSLDIEIEEQNCDSASVIIVDSLASEIIGDDTLQVQYLSYTLFTGENYASIIEVSKRIVERIGDEESFLFIPECAPVDVFAYTGLRCYSDDEIEYRNAWWKNQFNDVACDSLINDPIIGIENPIVESEILIYPNPASDYVYLAGSGNFSEIDRVEVFASSGQRIITIENVSVNSTIDVRHLQAGFYFVNVILNSENSKSFPLVKQ